MSLKVVHNKKHGKIKTSYTNWNDVKGLKLPTKIKINHQGRDFNYQFDDIIFNTNHLYQSLRTPFEKLSDEQQVRRLHQDMMDAHIHSDASLMSHIWADEIIMVNRGKISLVTGKAASQRMSQSLSMRKHSQYVDLELPSVVLSDDKTMAYLTVRVMAKGNRVDNTGKSGDAFEFTSAWMAVFKKFNGQWKMTANASNFE